MTTHYGVGLYLARYGLPIFAFIVTGVINWVYLTWPFLEVIGLGKSYSLGLINAAIVGLASILNLNLEDPKSGWTNNKS